MADLIVRITVFLPGVIEDTREEVTQVPPDYAGEDIRQFVGHAVESIGTRLLREKDFPTPVRTAFLGNVARLIRLEQLINEGVAGTDDRVREPFEVDAPQAISRWGEGLLIEEE